MKKNLIIDYSNILFRTIFAAHSIHEKELADLDFDSSDPQRLYKIFKNLAFNEIISHVEKFQPDRVILAIDSKNYWRKDIYPEYKSHRKEGRDNSKINFEEFFPIANKFTESLKNLFSAFYFISTDRCEADDIMATLSYNFSKRGEQTVVVSIDSDLKQLLSDKNISIYNPRSREMVICENPEEELMIKCISGDSGDDIPNIAVLDEEKYLFEGKRVGLGEVGAKKILEHEDFINCDFLIKKVETKYPKLTKDTIKEEIKKNFERNKNLIDLKKIPSQYTEAILNTFKTYELKNIDYKELNNFAMRLGCDDFVGKFYIYLDLFKKLNSDENNNPDFIS